MTKKKSRLTPIKADPEHLVKLRHEMIVAFVVNILECVINGDGLGDRDSSILTDAFNRVAANAFIENAWKVKNKP